MTVPLELPNGLINNDPDRTVTYLRDVVKGQNEHALQLQRATAYLTSELSLKEAEAAMYYKHMANLQQRLNSSNDQLSLAHTQIRSGNEVNTENLRLLHHYKGQCNALRTNLLEAERRIVKQYSQILQLRDHVRELQKSSDHVKQTPSGSGDADIPAPSSTTPVTRPHSMPPTATNSIAQQVSTPPTEIKPIATEDAMQPPKPHVLTKEELQKLLMPLQPTLDAISGHSLDSNTNAVDESLSDYQQLFRQMDEHDFETTPLEPQDSTGRKLNPQSAPFQPANGSVETRKPPAPAEQPLFIKPVKRTVAISPPESKSNGTKSNDKRHPRYASPPSDEGTPKQETLSENLQNTLKHIAAERIRVAGRDRPEDWQPEVTSGQSDNAMRQWLDKQLHPKPIGSPSSPVSFKDHTSKLIDFSSENSPEPITPKTAFRSADSIGFPPESPAAIKKENVPLVSYSPTPNAAKQQEASKLLPPPKFDTAPTHKLEKQDSSASYLGRPAETSVKNPVLSAANPAFKNNYLSKINAFTSRWSTPKNGLSRATSQATSTSTEQPSRHGSEDGHPIATGWTDLSEAEPAPVTGKEETKQHGNQDSWSAKLVTALKKNVVPGATWPTEKEDTSNGPYTSEEAASSTSTIRASVEDSAAWARANGSKERPGKDQKRRSLEDGEVSPDPPTLFHEDDTTPDLSSPEHGASMAKKDLSKDADVELSRELKERSYAKKYYVERQKTIPITGTRVLGGNLKGFEKDMVIKKDAWGLCRHYAYDEENDMTEFISNKNRFFGRDICNNLWWSKPKARNAALKFNLLEPFPFEPDKPSMIQSALEEDDRAAKAVEEAEAKEAKEIEARGADAEEAEIVDAEAVKEIIDPSSNIANGLQNTQTVTHPPSTPPPPCFSVIELEEGELTIVRLPPPIPTPTPAMKPLPPPPVFSVQLSPTLKKKKKKEKSRNEDEDEGGAVSRVRLPPTTETDFIKCAISDLFHGHGNGTEQGQSEQSSEEDENACGLVDFPSRELFD